MYRRGNRLVFGRGEDYFIGWDIVIRTVHDDIAASISEGVQYLNVSLLKQKIAWFKNDARLESRPHIIIHLQIGPEIVFLSKLNYFKCFLF